MKPLLLLLIALVALNLQAVRADDAVVPGPGFPASRYEALWKKSPFAVATTEASEDTSPDYTLVGIANFDGITYGSVIETKPPQEHFLISTDRANRGLRLTSISIGQNGADTYATVLKDGQSITLKLEQSAATPVMGAQPNQPLPGMPGAPPPQIPMPGSNPFPGYGSTRPFTRFHRLPIHLPPMPAQQQPPQQQQPPPPPQ
jgi:hypothetical protein